LRRSRSLHWALDNTSFGPSTSTRRRTAFLAGSRNCGWRPHSYDLLDNFGRRSPQTFDRSLLDVRVGDSVMRFFTVTAVVPGTSMNLGMSGESRTGLFGQMTIHYGVERLGEGSRLAVQLVVPPANGPLKELRRYALAWGDLLMMRKQLKELKRLAEATAADS
jgi:hypothetical protein